MIHVWVQTDVSLMVDGAMYPHPGPLLPHDDCSMMSAVRSTGVDRGQGNDRPVSAVL